MFIYAAVARMLIAKRWSFANVFGITYEHMCERNLRVCSCWLALLCWMNTWEGWSRATRLSAFSSAYCTTCISIGFRNIIVLTALILSFPRTYCYLWIDAKDNCRACTPWWTTLPPNVYSTACLYQLMRRRRIRYIFMTVNVILYFLYESNNDLASLSSTLE